MTTLTTPAVSITPEVVGKAVYLELKPIETPEGGTISWYGSKGAVKQIIVFPSGLTPEGHKVPPSVFERIVSPAYPRSQWDSSSLRPQANRADYLARGEKGYRGLTIDEFQTESEAESLTPEVKNSLYLNAIEQAIYREMIEDKSYFDEEEKTYKYNAVPAWTISTKFAVEVTDKDLSEIRAYKTPQAVIRRITKARVAAGLPEKLV